MVKKKSVFKSLVFLTVVAHYTLFFALVLSAPYLLIYEAWYVAIPVVVWLINLMAMPVRCPLTTLENKFRALAGMPKINGFVSRWILFREK